MDVPLFGGVPVPAAALAYLSEHAEWRTYRITVSPVLVRLAQQTTLVATVRRVSHGLADLRLRSAKRSVSVCARFFATEKPLLHAPWAVDLSVIGEMSLMPGSRSMLVL